MISVRLKLAPADNIYIYRICRTFSRRSVSLLPCLISPNLTACFSASIASPINLILLSLFVLLIYLRLRPAAPATLPKGPEPIVFQTFTPRTLLPFNGENGKPIYFAVKGQVFDVSSGANFYGPYVLPFLGLTASCFKTLLFLLGIVPIYKDDFFFPVLRTPRRVSPVEYHSSRLSPLRASPLVPFQASSVATNLFPGPTLTQNCILEMDHTPTSPVAMPLGDWHARALMRIC